VCALCVPWETSMVELTALGIAKLKPRAGRYTVPDGRGLFVAVYPSGERSFIMRLRRAGGGKPGKLTLGPVARAGEEISGDPKVGMPLTLAQARQLAAKVRGEKHQGLDPFAVHRVAKRRKGVVDGQTATACGPLLRQFIEEHAKPNVRRWRELALTLGMHYPVTGGEPTETKGGLAALWKDMPVGQIDGDMIHDIITDAVKNGTPGRRRLRAGASNARGRHLGRALSRFFKWLRQNRIVKSNPCADVHIPGGGKSRDRTLQPEEIRLLWQACDKVGAPFGVVAKLLLLSGQRRNEVGHMQHHELNEAGLWSLSGDRTKNGLPHVVPLAPVALSLLRSVPRVEGCPYVFTTTGARPISGWSVGKRRIDKEMLALAREADTNAVLTPWTLHDLRRTFVTGANELGLMPHVIEAVVNHVTGVAKAGVAGVYNKSVLLDERREALRQWADHVQGLVTGQAVNVVPMRRMRKRGK
jgi:integrase